MSRVSSISFDEIFRLAACPYCKAQVGAGCSDKRRKPYDGKSDDSPHLSRVKVAVLRKRDSDISSAPRRVSQRA
jgi:hypothetical protein